MKDLSVDPDKNDKYKKITTFFSLSTYNPEDLLEKVYGDRLIEFYHGAVLDMNEKVKVLGFLVRVAPEDHSRILEKEVLIKKYRNREDGKYRGSYSDRAKIYEEVNE